MAGGKGIRRVLPAIAAGSIACLLLWGVAEAAERWKEVRGKGEQDRVVYDIDSVVPSGPDRFRVRIAGFGEGGTPRKSVEEFDCANRIVRDVEVVVERPGKPVSHSFTPTEWRDVPRDSSRGTLLKSLCR